MNKLLVLPAILHAGPLLAQPNPDPATGFLYAKWGFSLIPIAIGVFFQLMTLWITLTLIRQCIQHRRYRRTSGFPFVGPLFISLGLWWSPSIIPLWVYCISWGVELISGISFVVVQRATHAEVEVTPPARG